MTVSKKPGKRLPPPEQRDAQRFVWFFTAIFAARNGDHEAEALLDALPEDIESLAEMRRLIDECMQDGSGT